MAGLANYGNRVDGTPKGNGFFGALPLQDGSDRVATELSMSFDYGKGDVLVPLLNPYLSETERLYLLQGKEPTEEILDKTGKWGFDRLQQGRSPFVDEIDQQQGLTGYRGK